MKRMIGLIMILVLLAMPLAAGALSLSDLGGK